MAKVIEFYVPTNFSRRVKWVPSQLRGRVIGFRLPTSPAERLRPANEVDNERCVRESANTQ
jgi:hypothetical protein